MKPTTVFAWAALYGLAVSPACAQSPSPSPSAAATTAASPPPAPPATPAAEPSTAATRVYQFALLRKGPTWTADDTPEVRALQQKHLANIARLAEGGQLVAAGPCGDGDLRGVFVFAAGSMDEARQLAETDPAVQAGRLRLEWLTFVGTPGIGRGLAERRGQEIKPEDLVEYQLALVRFGPRFDAQETAENRALFMARNAWLESLANRGVLVVSGPFIGGGELSGLLVLRAGSLEAARGLLQGDPAVKTERFAFDLHPWWLPKGALE